MINKKLIRQLSKEDVLYITQAYIKGLKDLTIEAKTKPNLALTIDTALLVGDSKITFDLIFERMKL